VRFSYEAGGCKAELVDLGGGLWEIGWVLTLEDRRGMGDARELMALVLADADEEGTTLGLVVAPSGPLDFEALAGWYARLGFEWTDMAQGEMQRGPQ
jgi:ribosomal protein S18 acetylase RimI-like enzyme